jgi:TIR domain
MQQKIVLSYSRRDEAVAEAVIKTAAARNLSIWYDKLIPAGRDWRDSIVDAIETCDVLVILFSKESNNSRQLIKELAIADRFGKLVIPVLIEATEPRGAYLYEMASRNWINLHPNPLARLDGLMDRLVAQLSPPMPAAAQDGIARLAASARPAMSAGAPLPKGFGQAEPKVAAQTSVAQKLPVKWWDLLVLGAVLSINFVIGLTPGEAYPAPGFNMFVLLAYMFLVAVRNAKLNIGIDTWKSFSIYLGLGLLIIPFGLAIDWINGVQKFENFGLTAGFAILAVIIAGVANLVQFVLRKVLQRSLFKSRIGEDLPAM